MINAKSPQIMEGMAKPCRHVGMCEKSPKTSKQQTSTIHAISSQKVCEVSSTPFLPGPPGPSIRETTRHTRRLDRQTDLLLGVDPSPLVRQPGQPLSTMWKLEKLNRRVDWFYNAFFTTCYNGQKPWSH